MIVKLKGPFPSTHKLAEFERTLPSDMPKGLGHYKHIRADKRKSDVSLSKHRRRYGISQVSSNPIGVKGYIYN